VQKKSGEIAHAPIVSRSQNLKKRSRILQFATAQGALDAIIATVVRFRSRRDSPTT
jgi:hypothetical protein